jgi:NTE family protein
VSAGTAIVLSGGGERAVAWELGVLAGLVEAGIDASSADRLIGTSAGAYVATRAAAGADLHPAADAMHGDGHRSDASLQAFVQAVTVWNEAAGGGAVEARRRVGAFALTADTCAEEDFLTATAARLPTEHWPGRLVLTAVDAGRGDRVAFRAGEGVPLAAALAASRAIPGLLPPITIGGRRYMDGAVGSAANADLAAGAEWAIVVTPTPADPPPNTLFAVWEAALEDEVHQLEAGGTRVSLVRADHADQVAMGPDLMSGARRREAFAAGKLRGLLLP